MPSRSSSIDLLSAIHEALVLTLRLDNAVDLQLRLYITKGTKKHLHNVNGINTGPIRHSTNTSSHELSEHSLILHIGERLFLTPTIHVYLTLLEHHATIPFVHAKVERYRNHITKKGRAETLVATKDSVHVDDLLNAALTPS